MALTYIGDCSFAPLTVPEPITTAMGVPGTRITWLGRSDELTTFLATYAVGTSYLDGYVTGLRPSNHSPGMMAVEIEVTLPPSESQASESTIPSVRTVSLARQVSGSIDANGRYTFGGGTVQAERSVTFTAPETTWNYFALSRPTRPRYTQTATAQLPTILRSSITVTDGTRSATFAGATAPAQLVAALAMIPTDKVTGPLVQQIEGTPWYRCTDVVAREFAGAP